MFLGLISRNTSDDKKVQHTIDVQAIIFEAEEYNFFFNKRWRAKYTYKYKGTTYNSGKGGFEFLLSIGQPAVVKVDTLNPNNSICNYFGLKNRNNLITVNFIHVFS